MFKKKKKDMEFEKSKKEFLQYMKTNSSQEVYPNERSYYDGESDVVDYSKIDFRRGDKKTAYEYELDMYRKSKVLSTFHTVGAICGIMAFVLVIYLERKDLLDIIEHLLSN